jgi:hypothetical protein
MTVWYSMPGFLEVYGYYSSKLKKWNIEVCFLYNNFYETLTISLARSPATHLILDDHRHLCFILDGWSRQRQV